MLDICLSRVYHVLDMAHWYVIITCYLELISAGLLITVLLEVLQFTVRVRFECITTRCPVSRTDLAVLIRVLERLY